ncbi:hypothetical protein SAICODRAFT_31908 [Saitoella complicata NRRL Y-17804]|nr:uncharacterized protein SAICODRAFT_31908 [Saitoella complicata NRRL Y-17804]ODQ50361.1 hypothetical protein SAICODRAFT_31908 [Saitoella complicata NRRL Y-17804]
MNLPGKVERHTIHPCQILVCLRGPKPRKFGDLTISRTFCTLSLLVHLLPLMLGSSLVKKQLHGASLSSIVLLILFKTS